MAQKIKKGKIHPKLTPVKPGKTAQKKGTLLDGGSTEKSKAPENQELKGVFGGLDGTRTRDPMRDRHVF